VPAAKGNKYASYNNTERLLNKPKRDWVKRDLNSFAGKKTIAKYNQFRMQNQSEKLTKDQWKEVGLTYRPTAQYPEYTVKRFLENEQVKDYANSELIKVLTDNGITLDFLTKEKKQLLELSKENKQLSVTLRTIESFENNLGLNQTVKVSETRQISSNLEDNYNRAKQIITITSARQGQSGQSDEGQRAENGEKTRENTSEDAENEQKTKDE